MPDQACKSIHPEALELVKFWESERGDRPLPGKAALNPTKLRRWIGDLSIIELHDDPKRHFVRLHGGTTQNKIGNDMTRRYFEDELDPKTLEFALTPYRAAQKSLRPTHSLFVPKLYPTVFTQLERLVLPFSAEQHCPAEPTVDQFLVWVGPTGRSRIEVQSVYDLIDGVALPACDVAEAVELEVLSL